MMSPSEPASATMLRIDRPGYAFCMGEEEQRTAGAMERLVSSNAFGELFVRATENVMGLTRIGFDVLDLTVRNLRLAGRPDLIRLGRQLARNEDKLERVLQEVEGLQDQVRELEGSSRSGSGSRSGNGNGRSTTTRSRSQSSSSSSRSRSSNGRSRSSGGARGSGKS